MLFCIKIFAAGAYYLFFNQPTYLATSDTIRYYQISLQETDWLLHDPIAFVRDLFTTGYDRPGTFFSTEQSYWNNLKDNVFIKMLAVCNLFTNGSYFADAIIFNLFYFIGPLLLFRIINDKKIFKTILLCIIVFLIPSFLFWQSGLHKDGLIFTSFMVIVYLFSKIIETNSFTLKRHLLPIVISTALLFSFRNYMLILMAPALLGWWLVHRYNRLGSWFTAGVYAIGLVLFFCLGMVNEDLSPLKYIVTRHNEFVALGGGSQLTLPPLDTTLNSFPGFLPYAIDIALLRPHFLEMDNMSYWPAIAENAMMVIVIISIFLSWGKKIFLPHNVKLPAGLLCFLLCFTSSFLLLAGYTITLTGAIVRYRSFVLPFLVLLIIISAYRKGRSFDGHNGDSII